MKKIILIVSLIIGVVNIIAAQEISEHAIGIRFGDNDGFGGEISYQKKMAKFNRLEFNLGYRNHKNYDALKLSGIYQWVWSIEEGFNWYVGVGAGLGSWSYSKGENYDNDGLFVNADGNIGVEYSFSAPFMLSLDFRPEIGLIGGYGNDTDLDMALSLRYKFK